jgi:hypothetical protein
MSELQNFVIEFDRRSGDRHVTEVEIPHLAMELRLQLEAAQVDKNIEIAALSSTSLETLQRTHSRYFMGKERSFVGVGSGSTDL